MEEQLNFAKEPFSIKYAMRVARVLVILSSLCRFGFTSGTEHENTISYPASGPESMEPLNTTTTRRDTTVKKGALYEALRKKLTNSKEFEQKLDKDEEIARPYSESAVSDSSQRLEATQPIHATEPTTMVQSEPEPGPTLDRQDNKYSQPTNPSEDVASESSSFTEEDTEDALEEYDNRLKEEYAELIRQAEYGTTTIPEDTTDAHCALLCYTVLTDRFKASGDEVLLNSMKADASRALCKLHNLLNTKYKTETNIERTSKKNTPNIQWYGEGVVSNNATWPDEVRIAFAIMVNNMLHAEMRSQLNYQKAMPIQTGHSENSTMAQEPPSPTAEDPEHAKSPDAEDYLDHTIQDNSEWFVEVPNEEYDLREALNFALNYIIYGVKSSSLNLDKIIETLTDYVTKGNLSLRSLTDKLFLIIATNAIEATNTTQDGSQDEEEFQEYVKLSIRNCDRHFEEITKVSDRKYLKYDYIFNINSDGTGYYKDQVRALEFLKKLIELNRERIGSGTIATLPGINDFSNTIGFASNRNAKTENHVFLESNYDMAIEFLESKIVELLNIRAVDVDTQEEMYNLVADKLWNTVEKIRYSIFQKYSREPWDKQKTPEYKDSNAWYAECISTGDTALCLKLFSWLLLAISRICRPAQGHEQITKERISNTLRALSLTRPRQDFLILMDGDASRMTPGLPAAKKNTVDYAGAQRILFEIVTRILSEQNTLSSIEKFFNSRLRQDIKIEDSQIVENPEPAVRSAWGDAKTVQPLLSSDSQKPNTKLTEGASSSNATMNSRAFEKPSSVQPYSVDDIIDVSELHDSERQNPGPSRRGEDPQGWRRDTEGPRDFHSKYRRTNYDYQKPLNYYTPNRNTSYRETPDAGPRATYPRKGHDYSKPLSYGPERSQNKNYDRKGPLVPTFSEGPCPDTGEGYRAKQFPRGRGARGGSKFPKKFNSMKRPQ